MVPFFHPGRVDSALVPDDRRQLPERPNTIRSTLSKVLLLDSRAWRAARGAPFRFIRWLGALTAVVVSWIQSSAQPSAVSYVPVLVVVGVLLLPDAKSIEIAGFKFERLASEMADQQNAIKQLTTEVSLINNTLVAGSQVNIALGTASVESAPIGMLAQRGGPPPHAREPVAPDGAAEASQAGH